MLRAPARFVDTVLRPEFVDLNAALTQCLAEVTERIIREEVHGVTAEAEERDRPGARG